MTFTLDLVLLAFRQGELQVLVTTEADGRPRRELPWVASDGSEPPESLARQAVRSALAVPPAWLESAGVFDGRKRHPSEAPVSLVYVGLMPGSDATTDARHSWVPLDAAGSLAPRQRAMLDGALAMLRDRLDFEPLAFRLLPSAFTLSELQQIYERLLGNSLHKASFRRALQSAELVQPLNEFRSEGRGRPAQLFRYAPKPRKAAPRSARFDLMARD
jgi:8-oxo-dGTP diphosphatase